MSISDVKQYLQQRGEAPLDDIANHFGTESTAVLGMLEHWERKGRISRTHVRRCSCCGRCSNCTTDMFSWVE